MGRQIGCSAGKKWEAEGETYGLVRCSKGIKGEVLLIKAGNRLSLYYAA